jgi:2-C-methyl-D-erythritol 2,4-cyclodiphosphate synthase
MSDETSDKDDHPANGPAPTRVGIGHDLHRLVDGAPLVLGGVEIPAQRGFATHSDGDVLCHALIDALAGALADGDLGTHFPEDDPAAEDARSIDFVVEFGGHVRDAGFDVVHVDSFVVLGTTRLRPHIETMRANLAAALGVDLARVSVKARSNDGIGPEGEGSAASAWAAVLLAPARRPSGHPASTLER